MTRERARNIIAHNTGEKINLECDNLLYGVHRGVGSALLKIKWDLIDEVNPLQEYKFMS